MRRVPGGQSGSRLSMRLRDLRRVELFGHVPDHLAYITSQLVPDLIV